MLDSIAWIAPSSSRHDRRQEAKFYLYMCSPVITESRAEDWLGHSLEFLMSSTYLPPSFSAQALLFCTCRFWSAEIQQVCSRAFLESDTVPVFNILRSVNQEQTVPYRNPQLCDNNFSWPPIPKPNIGSRDIAERTLGQWAKASPPHRLTTTAPMHRSAECRPTSCRVPFPCKLTPT